MSTRLSIMLFFFLTACAPIPAQQPTSVSTPQALTRTQLSPTEPPFTSSPTQEDAILSAYPDLGPAPEIVGDVWLNTDAPLRLGDLRGKVVMIEMWTYGCINCRNTIASLRGWHEQYASQGLIVIGNHFPEFRYEHDLDNLKQAVVDLNIPYPVVQDNEGINWDAYNNRYWPCLYLIDKQGHIRYVHIGEGAYEETEAVIQSLLNEPEPR